MGVLTPVSVHAQHSAQPPSQVKICKTTRKIPMTTPSGRTATGGERRKREKNAINSGHYVLPAMTKGSAHNSLGPKLPVTWAK